MHNNDTIMRCRVCGLLQNQPPWGADGNCPTYEYCPCCGVEFGYGDASPVAIQRWREKWLAMGAAWAEPEEKPANWDLQEQLNHVANFPSKVQG
jgi:hypothetical protein